MSDQPPHSAERITPADCMRTEMTVLQEVINEHERHAFTVLAILVAVLGGLATLAFSIKIDIEAREIRWLGFAAIVAFWIWATVHRGTAGAAIRRYRKLEKLLREGRTADYDGPRASITLSGGRIPLGTWAKAFIYPAISLPLAIAAFAIWQMSSLIERQTARQQDNVSAAFRQLIPVQAEWVTVGGVAHFVYESPGFKCVVPANPSQPQKADLDPGKCAPTQSRQQTTRR